MRDRRRSCGCEVPVRNVVVLPTARRRRRFSRQIHDDDDGGRSFVSRTGGGGGGALADGVGRRRGRVGGATDVRRPGGGGGVVVVDLGVAEAAMFRQRAGGRERLPAGGAADALAAVGVRPLVSAEVRELGVGLEADFTLERLDAAVDVLVLFETARRRERLQITSTIIVKIT